MSKLEDLLFDAEEQGFRLELLERVRSLRVDNPRSTLEAVYDMAYEQVKKEYNEVKTKN